MAGAGNAAVGAAFRPRGSRSKAALVHKIQAEWVLISPRYAAASNHTSIQRTSPYYFGVLTLAGRNALGNLKLTIPNLVIRKLYVERLQEQLLPRYEDQEQRQQAVERLYSTGDLGPLCDLLEQKYFKVFDNRDLRWSNERVIKTAFIATLFNDAFYIMDSELELDGGYSDLALIVRPDMRQYTLLDHLLEFKALSLKSVGLSSEQLAAKTREELRELPSVAEALAAAETQLARYRPALEQRYGAALKLQSHAVVGIGLERLVC